MTAPLRMALSVTLALAACSDPGPAPLPSAGVVRSVREDPDALPEGPLVLFGLRFPIRSIVIDESSRTADVEVPFPLEEVASYMRARITASSVNVGPSATIFSDATFRGVEGTDRFDVTVRSLTNETRITIRRRRPPPQAIPSAEAQ